jgi:hypothetical protein
MSQVQSEDGCTAYLRREWGELIYGTKQQLQYLGIGIGLAFPGEPNGPARQLTVRDPRGLKVRIKSSNWKAPFEASIDYVHVPACWPTPKSTQFSGVRMQEGPWTDDFTGRAECLIAAGLATPEQLPGMRKMRVTILADGTILSGNYSNKIPGGLVAGIKHIERASPRAATLTVRIHVDLLERDRRESHREIAESAWLHEARKLPRPWKLTPRYGTAVVRHANSVSAARSDMDFQTLLGRLVQSPTGEAS